MEKVADWQIRQLGGSAAKTWIESTFYAGLMATYRTTHQAKYLDAVDAWGKANQWTLGPGRTNADDQCAGQAYVEAYDVDNNMAELTPTQTELGAMVAAPQAGRVVWWWADALFMSPPVFARVGTATSQSKYFDAMSTMYWDTVAFLQDKASGLFWRDSSFFGKTCPNGKGMFWARGNAWVIAGAARVIDELPPAYPDRAKFVALLRTMSTALLPLQRSDGYWSSCLTDAKDYPSPETSGTAGFTFALAWGVNRGLLDAATYGPAIQKGWSALAAAVNTTSGQLGWVQPVGGAPGPSALGDSAPYGTGLFLLAGSEVATLPP
jgi:unsaturated rhamnogalacturonyl hydrolase